jgi:hypothetical protein
MRVLLAATSIVLFSFSAFATPASWKRFSETEADAWDRQLITEFQNRYPEYLGNLDATQIASVQIYFAEFKFVGDSTCPAGDSRLFAHDAGYIVCPKTAAKPGDCKPFKTGPESPPDVDPCGN